MRDTQTVKMVRDQLRDELAKFLDKRIEMGNDYMNMSAYDKKVFTYLVKSISNLKIQINALTFVLNEDSYLDDVTEPNSALIENGITKESVLNEK